MFNREKILKETIKKAIIVIIFFTLVQPQLAMGTSQQRQQDNTFTNQVTKNFDCGALTLTEIGEEFHLRYQLDDLNLEPIIINDMEYTQVSLPGEPDIIEPGSPQLPHVCRSIIIPDTMELKVKVESSQYREYSRILVTPAKAIPSHNSDPETIPYKFGQAYQRNEWYPSQIATMTEPYILRDYRGQVIVLNPVQYNPVSKTLRYYYDITLEISPSGVAGPNTIVRDQTPTVIDKEFQNIYENHFLNFGEGRYTPVSEQGSMLIITYDAFYNDLLPYVEWKTLKGISTEIINVSQIGATSTAIRNYITSYYGTHDLTYVMLVGDVQQIPTVSINMYYGEAASDPTYSFIVGSDYYPDIFVGRFSAQNTQQLQTQITRSMEYERSPQVVGSWFSKGVGIASAQGPGDDNEYDYQHIRNIRTDLLGYTYTSVDEFYDGSQGGGDATGNPTTTMIATAVNDGRSIIDYCGHGSATSWGTSGFSNTDVNNLVNENKLPFIWSIACLVGEFDDYNECFAEAWLRSTNNGEPAGAVAAFMSSNSQFWNPPMDAQDEMIDLLTQETMMTFGGLSFSGCMRMNDDYPWDGNNGGYEMTETWHVFGDPSIEVRTESPQWLYVYYSYSIPSGSQQYTVHVIDSYGEPLSQAYVCLWKGSEVYQTGFTNSNGDATFTIAPSTTGTMYVTVTKHNYHPYEGYADVYVLQPVVYVDYDYYSNPPEGWGITHFAEIQDGIDHVLPGGTVNVYQSEYEYYRIIVNKQGIHIIARENRDYTVIAAYGSFDEGDPVVVINAPGVTLEGFTIKQEGPYSYLWDGIDVCTNGNLLLRNKVHTIAYGISVFGSSNRIYQNDVSSTFMDGLFICGSSNTIRDNDFYLCAYYGINLMSGTSNLIYHNNFINNVYHATSVSGNSWDAGPITGGNYWDTWPCHDNPSSGEPYYFTGGVDQFPFEDEDGWGVPTALPDDLLQRPTYSDSVIGMLLAEKCTHIRETMYTADREPQRPATHLPSEGGTSNTPTVTYPKNLSSPANQANYLIIAADSLYSSLALQSFAQYRATKSNDNVAVTKTSDIYKAVGVTIPLDPQLIDNGTDKDLKLKTFIKYAYEHWNNGQTSLGFILLVGDAYPQNATYYLPLHESTWRDAYGSIIMTDYWYSCIEDNNVDGLIDDNDIDGTLYIGRFSVQSPADITAIKTKIVQYESGIPWDTDVLLTHADGNGSSYLVHNSLPEIKEAYIDPNGTTTEVYMEDYATIQEGKNDLKEEFNTGHPITVFTGHAGTFWYLGDGIMFNASDIADLTNEKHPTVVISLACHTAMIDYANSLSLGESFTNIPEKGAVAFLGATRCSIPWKADVFLGGLMQSVYDHGTRTLGKVILEGKLSLQDDALENRIIYNLLGDPAMTIAV